MTIFIPDAYALAELEEVALASGLTAVTLQNKLNDLVDDAHIRVIAESAADLTRYLPDSSVTAWLRASKGSVVQGLSHYSFVDAVLLACPDIFDSDDPEMNPQVLCLALAKELLSAGQATTIVTAEFVDPPGRRSIAHACALCGVEVIDPATFVALLV